MTINKKKFFSNLNKELLIEKNPNVAVAVSGGPDSMALILLINEWIKIKKGKLIGIIVDHRLRIESIDECKKIKNLLKTYKINSKIIRVSKNNVSKKNMQEARNNRFGKMINHCMKKNILHIFLGHHFDDNLETYIIRKVSGSNIEGLYGMNFTTNRNKIQIIRPLLNYSKKEILKFNKANKIEFINDPSNVNLKYTRVAVREFLNNSIYKKKIKNDFFYIRKYAPFYKSMINLIMVKIFNDISKNYILIYYANFIKLDDLIKEQILEKIYIYFNLTKKIRSSKIRTFLLNFDKYNHNSLNFGNIIVKKNKELIKFSINK